MQIVFEQEELVFVDFRDIRLERIMKVDQQLFWYDIRMYVCVRYERYYEHSSSNEINNKGTIKRRRN